MSGRARQQAPEAGAGEGAVQDEAANRIKPQPNAPQLFLLPGQVLIPVGSYWVLLQQPVVLVVLVPVGVDGRGRPPHQSAASGCGHDQRRAC